MGEIQSQFRSDVVMHALSAPTLQSNQILTAWMLVEIRRLFERYKRVTTRTKFHADPVTFLQIITHSPVQGLPYSYSSFQKGPKRSINIFEFLCALVLYSSTSWNNKVMFLFKLVDFDNNRVLTRDEVTILCTAAINGVCCMTGSTAVSTGVTERISEFMFTTADVHPDGMITYDELEDWVITIPELIALLKRNQISENVKEPEMVFMHMNESLAFKVNILPPIESSRRRRTVRLSSEVRTFPDTRAHSRLSITRHGRTHSHAPTAHASSKKPLSSSFKTQVGTYLLSKHSEALQVRGRKVTKQEVKNLKVVFDRMDASQSGDINIDEFVQSHSYTKKLKELAPGMFQKLIHKHSRTLTFQEWLVKYYRGAKQNDVQHMMQWVNEWENEKRLRVPPSETASKPQPGIKKSLSIRTANDLKKLFSLYDQNQDGSLDMSELKDGLKGIFDSDEIERLFLEYDEDGDNRISLLEFMKMIAPVEAAVTQDIFA